MSDVQDEDYDDGSEEYLVAEDDRDHMLREVLDKALEQEGNGLPKLAWRILYENWQGYIDHEYYDEGMAILFEEQLELLYDRNPQLISQKIEFMLEKCRLEGYFSGGGYDVKTIEDAIKIAQDNDRPDLELEIIQTHASNQVNRYGGAYWKTEGLRERIEELEKQVEIRLEEKRKLEHAEDLLMPTNDLISDFAEGIMGVCNDSLEERKMANPNDYLDGDEIDYSVLHQSCHELFSILVHKEDAKEVIRQWTSHERWCVRALTKGAEHLLLEGSFNNSLDDSEDDSDSDGDDFDSFVDWADSVA